MIIVMRPDATKKQLDHLVKIISAFTKNWRA